MTDLAELVEVSPPPDTCARCGCRWHGLSCTSKKTRRGLRFDTTFRCACPGPFAAA